MLPRTFKYANRLAKVVGPKGLTPEQAVAAAEERLEVVKDRSLEEIDRCIAEIAALAPQVDDPDGPGAAKLYAEGNRVIAIAGVFALDELGEAAYSLCELITRFRAAGMWNAAMVAVHVDALVVMREQGVSAEHRRALREGLRRIIETVSPRADAAAAS